MKLDKSFLNNVKGPIYKTWDVIGSDMLESFGDIDNEEAMEGVLDADRLLLAGEEPAAHKLVREAVLEHGYMKVLKFLCKNINLV